ncbi:related to mitochondrial rhomboid protease [Rhynchosporium graminicola]|uniref:Related to mitochondrial rhomboid protease n=2 Tax=Rhynchosporium TaxID=38037 RepID=A0A1E1MG90_RHYSE|nr:related to mitochondrial rhomboid protease [Rhynchosporium commune]CZT48109.1 related to mitochondrial rhomboid protease [Rhynchosporium secalis]
MKLADLADKELTKLTFLTARLAQRSIRQFSILSSPFRLNDAPALGPLPSSRVWRSSNAFRLPAGIRTFASQDRIITHFEELPADYQDEQGLLFRSKWLSKEETMKIFGKGIDVNSANRLLRVLHGRRVAGTLADPSLTSGAFQKRYIAVGLKWLRENVPVDEIQCAGLRAQKELADMELEIVSDSERIGLWKPNSGNTKNVYGDGVFDRVRKAKEAKLDAIEAKKKGQADEIEQNTGTLQTTGPESRVELRRPGENPRLKYYLERAVVAPDKPPEMTAWARLWPSGLFTVLFIGGCVLFATTYTPPRKENRAWPDMPPAAATIISLILVNAIVFGAWHVPPAFRILNKYFISLPGYPRAASMLGNVISHQSLHHFGVNMFFLWFVGVRLHEEVGRGNFLAIYFSGGVFASFLSLSSWVLRNSFIASSNGASGAIAAIIATLCLLKADEKVRLFGVFPPENWPSISAIMLLAIFVAMDVYGVRRGNSVVLVDHWAHLGGYASGTVAAFFVRKQQSLRREREVERRDEVEVADDAKEGKL